MKISTFMLVLVASLTTSCMMHTVVSGSSYPGRAEAFKLEEWEGAPSRLSVAIHGASGKAYTDRTEKQAYLRLERRGGRPFDGRYELSGAAIGWVATWADDGREVTVRFYDMPDGHFSGEQGWEQLRQQLLVLRFVYDEQKSTFEEAHCE